MEVYVNYTHSQLYSTDSPISMAKHVASLRQYHLAYTFGQGVVWKVMFGLSVGCNGRGFGVDLLEHASVTHKKKQKLKKIKTINNKYFKVLYST